MKRGYKVVIRLLFHKNRAWCLVKRLLFWLALLFGTALALAGTAKVVDYFDVIRKIIELSKPYIPLMPWMMGFGLAIYLIHVPGVFNKLPELVDRLEEMLCFRFAAKNKNETSLSEEDKADLLVMVSTAITNALNNNQTTKDAAVTIQAPQSDNASSSDEPSSLKSEMEKTMDRLARIREWEVDIIQRHRERYGGVSWKPRRNSRFFWGHFDDIIMRNDEIIAVEAKAIRLGLNPKISLANVIRTWTSVKDRFRELEHKDLLLEILFCVDANFQGEKAFADTVRNCIGVQEGIRVYLYRFNANNIVENVEVIA